MFQAFTLTGDQVYCYPSLRYYSNNVDRVKFLTANVQEDIVKMGEELKMIRSEIDKNKQNLQSLNTEIHKNESEAKKTDTQLMKITQKIRKLTSVSYYIFMFCVLFDNLIKSRFYKPPSPIH